MSCRKNITILPSLPLGIRWGIRLRNLEGFVNVLQAIRAAHPLRCRKACTLLFSLLLCSFALFSQKHLFDARRITTEDGLANLMCMAVFKDRQGFVWAGTDYGLNRYDGSSFRLYTQEKNGLSNNKNIHRISQDAEGNLWLVYKTYIGDIPNADEIYALDVFDPKTERAVPFDVYFAGKAPFKAAEITLPEINDPKQRQWLSTNKGAIFRCDGDGFKKIFQREGAFFPFLTIDSADNIWAAAKNRLLCFDQSGKVLSETLLPGPIGGVYAGAGQSLWLSLWSETRISICQRTQAGELIPLALTRNGRPFGLKRLVYNFVHRSRKGYWFIQIDRQINVFNAQGAWLFNYHTLLGKEWNTFFLDCFEDERDLWLATPTGILQVSVAENRFHLIRKREKGYSDCRGIAEDAAGNIYFLDDYLFRWDPKTQTCTKLPDTRGAFALICVDSLLWSGNYMDKTLGFDLDLRTNKKVGYPVLNPDANVAFSVAKTDDPGRLLVGLNKGLAYIDLKTKQSAPFEQYNGFDLLQNSNVDHIHKNAAGFWLATEQGIFLMREKEGIVRHYAVSTGDLPFNHIRYICEDRDGIFWLATKGGGIIRWRPSLDEKARSESRQFTTADGLANNYTYAVYEDDYGKLWIPSDKGLMWMDKASFQVRTFLREDGLPHTEFNMTAHHRAKDGTLYFGGLGGLISLHPKDFVAKVANQTPLEFTGYYLLEGNAGQMTDKTQLLQSSDVITIRPDDKFFELHFTLLDFAAPERHRYAYQIEGYSENWNLIEENFIRITHLPYGHYTLKIKGQHSSSGWSERELALRVNVLKPFYLQWWFILVALVGMAGMVWLSVRARVQQLKKDRERLETEVQKRTRQIEQDKQVIAAQAEALQQLDVAKTHFFSNITHEFRTPLTLIIGPLEQLTASGAAPSPIRQRLSGVLNNARQLLALINQLLDLSKLEGRQMRTEAVHGDLVGYTQDLMNRFKPMADKKGQQLRFEADQAVWEAHFDKNAWDKIVYNLLSNAIKFTPKGGTVTLRLDKMQGEAQDAIHLRVTDTGIGIKTEALEHIFNRFYQVDASSTRAQGGTGIGLALVKELVELQGGDIRVRSEVDAGTSFDIQLPVLPAESLQAPAPLSLPESLLPTLPESEPLVPSLALAEAAPSAHSPKEKLKLLLIEDNEEMRAYIRDCLDASKYDIAEAADGEEGIQKAQDIIPDLIVSDVMMPGKNGFEVVQAIRGELCTSHIPLILLTAKASLESRLEGLARGADAYLTKPFSPQELALQISNLIALRQRLRARYQGGPAPEADPGFQQEDAFVAELRGYITANLSEPELNVEGLSRHFGISRAQFYRKLDALIAKPIGDFIRSIRLETAAQLLKERQLSIAEVAYSTGFSSPGHFSRTFKKAYGKAPSEAQ